MEKTPLFKNLRLMDNRIKDTKSKNLDAAGVEVANLHEAEELMRTLIARHAYEQVHMEWMWDEELNRNMFIVYTFWTNKE